MIECCQDVFSNAESLRVKPRIAMTRPAATVDHAAGDFVTSSRITLMTNSARPVRAGVSERPGTEWLRALATW